VGFQMGSRSFYFYGNRIECAEIFHVGITQALRQRVNHRHSFDPFPDFGGAVPMHERSDASSLRIEHGKVPPSAL